MPPLRESLNRDLPDESAASLYDIRVAERSSSPSAVLSHMEKQAAKLYDYPTVAGSALLKIRQVLNEE